MAKPSDPAPWEDLLAAVQEVTSAGLTPEIENLLVAALLRGPVQPNPDIRPTPPSFAGGHGEVTGYPGPGEVGSRGSHP